MGANKKMVQTTVRIEPDKLRELQYYLSLERVSLTEFFGEKVTDYLQHYREAHPERVPRGVKVKS